MTASIRNPQSAIHNLLSAPAHLYEAIVRFRLQLYEKQFFKTKHLNAPVISLGNLTVGGTGKTPLTAFIARFLRDEKFNTAILSRGYRRSTRGRVLVSDGKSLLSEAHAAGDEPYLLATSCPGVCVLVDKDRYSAGRWLESHTEISAFILDDGFQHLQLARDLNLLLLDATEPPDQLRMVPQGRLREPLSSMQRADAIIITRTDVAFDRAAFHRIIRQQAPAGTPIFHASHQMTKLRRLDREKDIAELLPADSLKLHPIAAISGIARPDRFITDLQRLGMNIALRRDFRDHHRYSHQELAMLIEQAKTVGAEALIVTEKDAANLPASVTHTSPLPIYAAQIEFRCEEEAELKKLILTSVTRKKTKTAS